MLVAAAATAPLIPWTLRNLHTLHRFEPLAPRYATDSDDLVMAGFNRWTKTWIADYVSVQEIYWSVPGSEMDFTRLPRRAFDSEQQREVTSELFADYNRDHDMTAELDARFAALARERVHAAPLRYYVWLPAVRIADMWLRPRAELLPSDPRWWEFNDDRRWLAVSLGFGLVNLVYVALGAAGLLRGRELFGSWTIRCISAAAFCISREPGKSRASLHAGMLSRGNSSGLGALSPPGLGAEDVLEHLPQGRVAHAEAGADVFGYQFDCGPVLHRVGLRQILHGLDQQALPIHVARI